jgi:uncharacterized membrane protein
MEEEGLGFKFWGGMIAVVIAAGIGGMIILFVFSRAVFAWGFLGAFLALAVILIGIAWIHDRRAVKSYEAE